VVDIRQDSSTHSGAGSQVSGGVTAGRDVNVSTTIIGPGKETRFPIRRENNFLWEIIAPILINKIGYSKIKRYGIGGLIVSVILFILEISSYQNAFLPKSGLIPFIPPLSGNILTISFYVIALLFVVSVIFLGSINFYHSMECPNCSKKFALEEIGHPFGIEVPTAGGYHYTYHRFFKCRYCGHELEDVSEPEFVSKKEREE
jgi:hypothetical protein